MFKDTTNRVFYSIKERNQIIFQDCKDTVKISLTTTEFPNTKRVEKI